MTKEEVLSELEMFLTTEGLFDEGIDVGEDKNEITYVICRNHEQYDAIEKFLNELDENEEIAENMYNIIEVVFSDEYSSCDDCGEIVRTSPDGYDWTPDFWINDNGLQCKNCTLDNPSYYIDSITNDYHKGNTLLTHEQLLEYDFIKQPEEYENGLHKGMNDNPKQIFDKIMAEGKYSEVIFNIKEVSQFYLTFEAYVRE